MQLYWLCYRQNNHISVFIEPGSLRKAVSDLTLDNILHEAARGNF
jgi:hypothetical protein